ncbi:MAG: hypothetical protein GXP25_16625 [Planctomycetes bacterium]|nr:hypothetical protein [Planctomycetota bacterium]
MQRRFTLPVLMLCLLVAMGSALGYSESPKETMAAWYQALMDSYEMPAGRLMDAVIGFYSEDLQDQFMPEKYTGMTPEERSRAERAMSKAVNLHREWGSFLVANDFKEGNFKYAEEHTEQGIATVVVRSDSNCVRSFRLIHEGSRGWVISQLASPNQYAALVRVLIIVAVAAVVVGLIAKKMIFS